MPPGRKTWYERPSWLMRQIVDWDTKPAKAGDAAFEYGSTTRSLNDLENAIFGGQDRMLITPTDSGLRHPSYPVVPAA